MSAIDCCQECGAPLPPYWPRGLCANCAIDGALALTVAESQTGLPSIPGVLEKPELPGPVREGMVFNTFGEYDLLEEIARGGMGVVFKARQRNLNRTVAVKMILAGPLAGKDFIRRFRTEASAAAILQHPNIVGIHDVGVHDGCHYFSMDYVEGKNLAELVGRQPLTPERAARYVAQLAEAIHYAHEHGILHRDLKPSNVLIDAADQPRITDFGLAKRLNPATASVGQPDTNSHRDNGEPGFLTSAAAELTITGQVLGSPNFMPPEQAGARRGRVGRPADVYGLGGILYYLLTARAPFHAESLEALIAQVLHVGPVAPRLLNPSIPADLETIVLKCLEKESGRRYQTTKDLADELGRVLRHEPIQARPVSTAEKLWRWCRRKPALAGALAFSVIALLAGLAATSWQWHRAERTAVSERSERERAEAQSYVSDMNLAQQALNLNNLGRARELLDRHRPKPGKHDLRGWEWRYLWQLTRSDAICTLANRPVRGFSVSFSRDGAFLAAGWDDGRVDLWDVPGRKRIRALTDREYRHEGRVAFSPGRNLLAATSEPGLVTLYDLDAGRESVLWRAADSGVWRVRDLTFSRDGSRLVIYAGTYSPDLGDEVVVLNITDMHVESRHPTLCSGTEHHGTALLSSDNRRLYLGRSDNLANRHSIQCVDLPSGKELWQTEPQRDIGLTTLAVSPNGEVLASGSGFEDSSIHILDAETGRLIRQLNGHTSWVGKLAFTRDGQRLISAAADQSIRFWDTSTWKETKVLRGHTDEVHSVAISEAAQLVASTGKDGNLMLWKADAAGTGEEYRRLPENLGENQVLPLDSSRILLLPAEKPPALLDLRGDPTPLPLSEFGLSSRILGRFGTNIVCHWNETGEIVVSELRGTRLVRRGAISLNPGTPPAGVAYNAARQLLAWTEGPSYASIFLASLATPDRRKELKCDVPGVVPFRFSDNGIYLLARTKGQTLQDTLRAWNVETATMVASTSERYHSPEFAAGGRVLVVAIELGDDHEIRFYDLSDPDQAPRRAAGRHICGSVAVSPDGSLVACSTHGGEIRLYEPLKGELLEILRGHLNAAHGVRFSPDGRRLISTSVGREAVKLWDVRTRQEVLTLHGTGATRSGWSDDGDVIYAGTPWQVWRAPSWAEIEAIERSTDR